MNLGHIERGTKMKIVEQLEGRAVSSEYEGTFRHYESGKLFSVHCQELYDNYKRLYSDGLNISFIDGPHLHTMTGETVEKQRSSGIIMIKQLTDIVTTNRRVYERDEIRVRVQIFGISETSIGADRIPLPDRKPDMTDMTFDVSAGGICVISNTQLNSPHDPYYLIDFAIGHNDKDAFLLPAKLVRRSNYPRTRIGRYDYGFQFIFDKRVSEKGRLTKAILSKKLSYK